jgi:rfaE bifunctional protein kinase chain/domain
MTHSSSAAVGWQESLNKAALAEVIARFTQRRALVLGDMAIDEMVYGAVDRLSREAPVVILKHSKTDCLLGAGANAAHNVAAYGAHTLACGVWGTDAYAPQLQAAMVRDGIDPRAMVSDPERPTTTKSRISGVVSQSITQQVVRLDRESREPLSPTLQAAVLAQVQAALPQVDAVLLSDYALGIFTPPFLAQLKPLLQQALPPTTPWVVDSQQPLEAFAGAWMMTPNQPEAEANVGHALDTREALLRGGRHLLQRSGAQHLLITLGQDGMALFEGNGAVYLLPVFNPSEVFDVTGAGDTVVATLLLALASGASPLQAAVLGNLAASLVVRHFGAAVTSVEELTQALYALDDSLLNQAIERL